ncbi:Hypothetical protein MexAM1_META1p1965 [Methylorubrum extorquens AM1]|uniref:Uncharacterized protein n=1 Tax=Methylorubrum extorquens (strain ATCC 14718 / DSM 1338 / JCM 2805 / NCIMB 9133 / AM1) TaxID=272630 RepID=C5B2C0_METEA|nr:Hypothetical protein MexAM1_META1p1965 [Methylorubrum extorquens AM1]
MPPLRHVIGAMLRARDGTERPRFFFLPDTAYTSTLNKGRSRPARKATSAIGTGVLRGFRWTASTSPAARRSTARSRFRAPRTRRCR